MKCTERNACGKDWEGAARRSVDEGDNLVRDVCVVLLMAYRFVTSRHAVIEQGFAVDAVDRIELYTGPFAEEFTANPSEAIANYVSAANAANELGLGINAGHDLSLENLRYFKEQIPFLLEVSIGHALISDALYLGLENTIQRYKHLLR